MNYEIEYQKDFKNIEKNFLEIIEILKRKEEVTEYLAKIFRNLGCNVLIVTEYLDEDGDIAYKSSNDKYGLKYDSNYGFISDIGLYQIAVDLDSHILKEDQEYDIIIYVEKQIKDYEVAEGKTSFLNKVH